MTRIISIADSIVSPLGSTPEANFQAVLSGVSAVCRQEGTSLSPEPFAAALLDRDAVRSAAAKEGIRDFPFFETVSLLSALAAIRSAGIDPASPRTGFLLSTIKGNVEALPEDEASVPLGVSAERISGFFHNPGRPVVVSNACISGLCALIHARRLLLDGVYDHIVVTGCECQSRFIISGFQSLKALSASPCKPFDRDRDGLNAGEAAATMVLARTEGQEGWELVEGAVRNDANHISGPSRTGEGSYNALRYVLGHCTREELAFINVHGTATAYNDEMEAIALGRAGLSDVPVNALKGSYGHTMGAAGILETILSMRAADHGVILPTCGFSTLGVSRPVGVSAAVRTTDRKSFIKLLSGFGGCNAAMLFRKGGAR